MPPARRVALHEGQRSRRVKHETIGWNRGEGSRSDCFASRGATPRGSRPPPRRRRRRQPGRPLPRRNPPSRRTGQDRRQAGSEGRRRSRAAKAAPEKPEARPAVRERARRQPAAQRPAEAAAGSAPVRCRPPRCRGLATRRPQPDRPPPRPMAKAEIFVEGDHVVYPTHGVGKVERIATEEIAGHKLELIHITFEENRMTLRVPVAKARTAGLRKLATRKLFDEALAVLKGRARIKRTMWSRRAQEYEAKINSGDPLAIAEVVRDLHRNAGQPDQSFSERQIYEAAMDRLAAELAALDKTDKLTAASKLAIL